MKPRDTTTVTASEIAEWVYCNEAWRLSALGQPAANQTERDAGTERHAGLAVAETRAGGAIAIGRVLFILGLAALVLAWMLSR